MNLRIARNIYLPRPSPHAARVVKSAPEGGIMPDANIRLR
jgi:hypothetical protein